MSDTHPIWATRFWAKVDRNGPVPDYAPHLGPCWIWTACTTKGYGMVTISRRSRRAHRVAYELVAGPIPEGLMLDHLCRVKCCVNPAHLEPTTNRVNQVRGIAAQTHQDAAAARTHCKNGHPIATNLVLRPSGHRDCIACRRGRKQRQQAKLRAEREAA